MSEPYEKWLQLGERLGYSGLGYSGKELEASMSKKQQECHDREERARRREEAKATREAERDARQKQEEAARGKATH